MRGLSCAAMAWAFSSVPPALEVGRDPGRPEDVAPELPLETARRLGVGTIISFTLDIHSPMLVDKEGRRSMLRCSRSASWGTLGSNRAGGHAG